MKVPMTWSRGVDGFPLYPDSRQPLALTPIGLYCQRPFPIIHLQFLGLFSLLAHYATLITEDIGSSPNLLKAYVFCLGYPNNTPRFNTRGVISVFTNLKWS